MDKIFSAIKSLDQVYTTLENISVNMGHIVRNSQFGSGSSSNQQIENEWGHDSLLNQGASINAHVGFGQQQQARGFNQLGGQRDQQRHQDVNNNRVSTWTRQNNQALQNTWGAQSWK